MDRLKTLLREIMEKTRSTEVALDREYTGLGEELLDEELANGASAELHELHTAARETRESIKKSQAVTDRVTKLLSQQSEAKGLIEEKQGELAILEEEIEPHYEKVGRSAVEALIDEDAESAPFRKSIDQLRSLESDIRQLNRELGRSSMREEAKGVITQALSGGRKLYLQGLLRTKEMRSSSLYQRLGREVCSSDLISHLEAPAFVNVLEPVLAYREQKRKIEAQISTLTNKADRLQSEIVSLCGSDRPQRHLQRQQSERESAHNVLVAKLRDLGAQFTERAVGATSMAKGVKSRLASAKSVRKELELLGERRQRVEAAMQVESLERKVDGDRSRIRALENTVKKANKEIEGLSAEIKELNQERERLIQVRGPVEDLTLAPAEQE